MTQPKLYYVTERGAHVSMTFRSAGECEAYLKRLKRPAELRLGGQVIGGVEDRKGELDNPRHRWVWWLDVDAWD